MDPKTRSQVSSDREKWNKVFDGLVKLLKNQQENMETLVKERKILEDRINMQHERWVSDIRLYEDHISQMKEDVVGKDRESSFEAAKADFMAGLKQREASLNKLKLEQTEEELADFRAWFDYLSDNLKRISKETDTGKENGTHSNSKSRSKTLEDEVKRLKLENKKFTSEKNSEISALLREKSFVWNQYNILEGNLTNKLKSKEAEVEKANEKIAKVLASMELLQSANNEKDEMIGRLTTKVAEMEADRNKVISENSKVSQELELLRKSRSAQVTPVYKHCNAGTRTSTLRVRSNSRDQRNAVVKKELPHEQAIAHLEDAEKDSGNLKRQGVDVTLLEIPKLFSSSFKVPKLKISSPNS